MRCFQAVWPRTKQGERTHRKRKREREILLVIQTLSDFLRLDSKLQQGPIEILEFGSGDGFQIPYLERLGKVTASDISESETAWQEKRVPFVRCSITDTPFENERFDLIFSNHTLEHIEEIDRAFSELRRIGKPDCLYAFAVPTRLWLLFSIPAQYYIRLRTATQKLTAWDHLGRRCPGASESREKPDSPFSAARRSAWRFLLPRGHGIREDFSDCFRSFGIQNWKKLFESGGFRILKLEPLLLYGASEWPIVPTLRWPSRWGIASTVLFLLKKIPLRIETQAPSGHGFRI